MAGMVRGGIGAQLPPPVSRTGPTNAQGQALTPYEEQQAAKAKSTAGGTLAKSQFLSGANNNVGYDMSYTDDNGLTMKYGANSKPVDFNTQMNNFGNFMGRFGNMGGGGSSSLKGSGGLSGGASPNVTLDQGAIDSGDAAAYSRAKDQVGQSTQGLMKSLQNQFAGRGLRGSSIEGNAVGSALESQAGQLADVSRGQAMQGSQRATDLAKTRYAGDIQMRGQDMDAESQMRSIEANSQQSKLSSVLGLWNAFSGMRY
jgi:hypothetical protein